MNHFIQPLRAGLLRYQPEYLRAATTHPSLSSYPSAGAVLTALDLISTLSNAQRDGILRALVFERRASRHALWPSMLILAFEPALRRLRRRAGGWRVEDLDPMLVQSLLEAVDATSLRSGAFVLSVQCATARKLFQKLRARQRASAEQPFDEQKADVPWPREPSAFVTCAAREALRACARVPGGVEAALSRAGLTNTGTTDTVSTVAERRLHRDRERQRGERVLCRVREELVGDAR